MLTGVLNSDNVSQVLRSIAQRRQQGVLEVNFADRRVDIVFVQGKVVDVQFSDEDPVADLLAALQSGGVVEADFMLEAASYEELYQQLVQRGVAAEIVKRALRHRVLDRLYRLDFTAGAYYNFKVQMVEGDRDLLPGVSVGQLLLDLVSLESQKASFYAIFPPGSRVKRGSASESFVTEEERAVYEAVFDGATVEEVAEASMLSRFHLREALMALHERGGVEVEHQGGAKGPALPVDFDVNGIVDALEQTAAASLHDGLDGGTDFGFEGAVTTGEEQDAEDVEGGGGDPWLQVSFWSARLLQENLVPQLVVYLFLAAVLLLPFLCWSRVFARFGF